MTTTHTDRLVEDYLRRLDAAAIAVALPPERRTELVAEIREHLREAVRDAGPDDEVAVRNVLERLGPPDEIVAAATEPPASSTTAGPTRPRGRITFEIVALIVLAVGFVLPFLVAWPGPLLAWIPAAVLIAMSRVWSGRDKLLALVLLPFLAGLFIWFTTSSHLRTDEQLILGPAISAPLAAGYLGWRLRARSGA